ncbi:MAG: 2-dehydropantoate 2-reductase N-terminal domain-containing protein [Gemmatimonadota bacterium]
MKRVVKAQTAIGTGAGDVVEAVGRATRTIDGEMTRAPGDAETTIGTVSSRSTEIVTQLGGLPTGHRSRGHRRRPASGGSLYRSFCSGLRAARLATPARADHHPGMKALVVGAGVVGQVHGYHLARGGATVGFLVKPEHAGATRAGLTLYPLNRLPGRRSEPERFDEYSVYDSVEEVSRESWNQVYLTMSSTALRAGDWFAGLAAVVGDATIVLLQPGPQDRDFVRATVPEDRVVQGTITLIGYRAPLPGEARFPEPGVAYWLPPLSASPMSGPAERVAGVVESLNSGGLPARHDPNAPERAAFGAALLIPLISELERADWRFHEFRRGEHLALATRASREAMRIVGGRRGVQPPLALRLAAHTSTIRALLRTAPLAAPFDLETYLRVHFTKVGDQTRDMLRIYLDWAGEVGLPAAALATVAD